MSLPVTGTGQVTAGSFGPAAGSGGHPVDDSWAAVLYGSPDGEVPLGLAVAVDERRLLTCAHVVDLATAAAQEAAAPEAAGALWAEFPKADDGHVLHPIVSVLRSHGRYDLALLGLDSPMPPGVVPAPLRRTRPVDLVGRRWWAYGFPSGSPRGNVAAGQVGATLGYGFVRIDSDSATRLHPATAAPVCGRRSTKPS